MRKRGAYAALAGAALFMACTLSFTSFAKEERTPVGKIKLNFTSDIQAGERAWRMGSVPLRAWILSMRVTTG